MKLYIKSITQSLENESSYLMVLLPFSLSSSVKLVNGGIYKTNKLNERGLGLPHTPPMMKSVESSVLSSKVVKRGMCLVHTSCAWFSPFSYVRWYQHRV